MRKIPDKLYQQLEKRKLEHSLRKLSLSSGRIDFCSNDYLGFSRSEELYILILEEMAQISTKSNGATGSRLISGNNALVEQLEIKLSSFFEAEAALFFNSGYSANQAVLSTLPQRGDMILYDELVHASIKDGMRLSFANKTSFKHNNLEDLERKLKTATTDIYVVVESVYSMDGDMCPIKKLTEICTEYGAYVIVDEAHSVGVMGDLGKGLCIAEETQNSVLTTVYTFGKALGVHGACVVGHQMLIDYLVNFSRPFIYTTALPIHSVISVSCALDYLQSAKQFREHLNKNIAYFQNNMEGVKNDLLANNLQWIESHTAIQGIVVPGNRTVRDKASQLQQNGLDVRPILSPTVKVGTERLRICLHAYNTFEEIDLLIDNIVKK